MDISTTTAPKSDQVNFEDYIGGARTHQISEVRLVPGDQPVEIHLADMPGRPYKPSKTMRRVLIAAWGKDGLEYVGRRLTLFGNPDVKWAGQAVGGIQISHMSHLTKPLKLALTETRGKKTAFTIQPLPDVDPALAQHLDTISTAATIDDLKAAWEAASAVSKDPQIVAATNRRKAELTADVTG